MAGIDNVDTPLIEGEAPAQVVIDNDSSCLGRGRSNSRIYVDPPRVYIGSAAQIQHRCRLRKFRQIEFSDRIDSAMNS